MLRARVGSTIYLGLTAADVQQLIDGKAIDFSLGSSHPDFAGYDFILLAGEDSETLAQRVAVSQRKTAEQG